MGVSPREVTSLLKDPSPISSDGDEPIIQVRVGPLYASVRTHSVI